MDKLEELEKINKMFNKLMVALEKYYEPICEERRKQNESSIKNKL